MKYAKLILFIAIILAACSPSSSNITTKIDTATPSFTPTVTLTSTPVLTFTSTPVFYVSCIDPQLRAKVLIDFKERTGITTDQAYMLYKTDPDFSEGVGIKNEPPYEITVPVMYEGYRIVKNPDIGRIFCIYGRPTAESADGVVRDAVPIVLAWEDGAGNFFPLGHISDRASVMAEGEKQTITSPKNVFHSLTSMEDLENFMESVPYGGIFAFDIHSFKEITQVNQVVTKFGEADLIRNIQNLLRLLGAGWVRTHLGGQGGSLDQLIDELDSAANDQGLFTVGNYRYFDEGNLISK